MDTGKHNKHSHRNPSGDRLMRHTGISNVIATVLLIAVAMALVAALASFVFGILGNTVRNPNWPLMYYSLYNNYTSLKRNYTLLFQQYEELQSKYEQLLNKAVQYSCVNDVYATSTTNSLQGTLANSQNTTLNNSNNTNTSPLGYDYDSLFMYPSYFTYEISNISTFFIVLTIHNGLNTTVTLYNITIYVNNDVIGNATIGATYSVNSTDDILIALFPGTRIGESSSLGNYFNNEVILFNSTLPTNITAINVLIGYGYGNKTFTYSYAINQSTMLNT